MDSPTPHKTAEPTKEPKPTDTPIESQHLYDINSGYVKMELEANENLFGIKIEGSMVDDDKSGWETIRDDDKNIIFNRETYTPRNFDLYRELQPEQARALEEQYGYPESVVMEQADTDGDGALDKVAVRYEGSKGVLEFETEYRNRWDLTDHLITYLNNN